MYRIDPYDKSLVIEGFQKGIADSPFDGISDMRNVNIVSVPGEASVNFSTISLTLPTFTGTVTSADPSSDIATFTTVTGSATTGQAVIFSVSSIGGVSTNTVYWIVLQTPSTFKLYSDPAFGSIVDISGTGTGTFASVDMGKPVNRDHSNSTTGTFVVDANGRAWRNNTSYYQYLGNTTLTGGTGNGLVVYRGYLFIFRSANIDYMNTTTFAWTYGWGAGSPTAAVSHQALVGQDDTVYFCNASAVGSFFQKPGTTFDPGNGATYTFNLTALTLPSIDTAQCLTELGVNLLVGGANNAIYPWNRTATSFTYPILIAETNIVQMVTVNTNTYILAGGRGRIYLTNGSQAQLYKKIPDHISGTVEPYFIWGDLAANKNQLYVGLKATKNDTTAINQYGGVWAIDLDTEALRLTNQLSYGTYSGIASVIIPQPQTTFPGNGLLVGWDSGASTFGMDTTATNPYSGSQATIDSDLVPIGTFEKPRNFTRVEFRLTRPLVAGESVTLKQRLIFNTSDTGYTTVLTDSTVGDYSSSGPVNFKNAQWVQFQVVLNSTNSSPSYVRLKEIRATGIVS